ncbi:copper chaperone PCu(A)C [Streptomyces sp. NPDC048594]|uniref:copper chaperone PCu(A)C n=1 Tax=Streptomyces sp. NPDC048594 TaxID=3365575 RepID=UPI003716AD41
MTTPHAWTPTRRRLTDAASAALAPFCAAVLALGALSVWTAYGHAGGPPRIEVTDARLYLPSSGIPETAAFFTIGNGGGAQDRLVEVTSPEVTGDITLSRHRMTPGGAAYRQETEALPVPAGAGLDMSPHTSDVTVPAREGWRDGDLVPFTLRFEHSGRIEAVAVVVRPGAG